MHYFHSIVAHCAMIYAPIRGEYRSIFNPHLRVSINTTDGVGRDTEPSGV